MFGRSICAVAFFMFWMLSFVAQAQSSDSLSVRDAINDIEKKENVRFFYKHEWIENRKVSKNDAASLDKFLAAAQVKGITHTRLNGKKFIVLHFGPAPTMVQNGNETDTATTTSLDRLSNELVTISGVVEDANNDDLVIGATVMVEETGKGSITDAVGRYSFKVQPGIYTIKVTAIGKQTSQQKVNVQSNLRLNFEMFESSIQLEDVVISSERMNRNVSSSDMSQVQLDIKTLKTIPPFMGEVDVVKSILLLPGVSTVGEGSSGFNVRGGNVDQNLILQDDVPIFNASHLFGFFSTFNPDMVKDVVLYKGGMPANFGGRISSVLDVKMRDGNPNKLSASGGLGIIASRLLVEGPIGSEKTTFILGGRYAYPDWILKKVPDLNVSQSSAYFYDLNARVNHKFNDRNSLLLAFYRSDDSFKFAADTTYGWNTTNATIRWNTVLTSKLLASVQLITSKYQNVVDGVKAEKEFNGTFGIETQVAKVDFTYLASEKHKIDFGGSVARYIFNPGKLTPIGGSTIPEDILNDEFSTEQGYYITDEWKPSDKLLITAGVRFSMYSALGAGDVFVYDPEKPVLPSSIVDTLSYGKGQKIQTYSGWEPRVSLKWSLNDMSSIKMSYNRNIQYIQLISNTTAVSPLDLWRSSNYHIKPAIGNQVAIGYFRNFSDNRIEFSIETYYKLIDNLIEYKNGASLFMNRLLETQLLKAEGRSYGAELFVRKKSGKLTGWLSYTYARSFRKTVDTKPGDEINYGEYYPSNFDKPNDMSISANYAFTRRISMSANFTYSTGRPITYPTSVYVVNGYSFAQFSERNQARIPDYHRLDMSFTVEESMKRSKKWKGSWTFSIYNVYGRKNPYSVFFRPQYSGSQTQSYRLAVVGTIFPAITYNFKI